MLKSISISNLAVVTKLQVEFGPGLNLLTGETGSGKSIIVDALGVLLGGRASAEIIRSGEQKAYVEGLFIGSQHPELYEMLERSGIEREGQELVIRREVSLSGRSRAFINDQLTTVSFLRELRPFLVDIHGQGDQQTLLYPEAHIDLVDLFGALEKERESVKAAFQHWQRLEKELTDLRSDEAERLRVLDVLQFQLREIEEAQLELEEDERLQDEKRILVNAERLNALSALCYHILYEDESATVDQLATVAKRLDELAALDSRFTPHIEAVNGARYALEDVAYFLRDYADNINFSSERLKELEERLIEIERLKRKYGNTINEILQQAKAMRQRLVRLQSSEVREGELLKEIEIAKRDYMQLGQQLSSKRQAAANRLEVAVMGELQHLAMERTQFSVHFFYHAQQPRPTERGLDQVELLVSANVGEELRPLVKIASGGEISRLMLALKTITAPTEFPRTMVFDEVDVGIGGRVAEAVGQRLKRLAAANQVLCVTHQAQVARFADSHYSVEKHIVGERTEVLIERLDRKGRIEELARMIGGAEITELTRRHASELLKQ